MPEPMMQVPVLLIEELREAAYVAYKGPNDTDPALLRLYADKIRRGVPGGGSNLTAAVARVLDVVADALVWQPTPTAEPRCDGTPECQGAEHDKRCWRHRATEPPRIEDMAPGMTFKTDTLWTVEKDARGVLYAHTEYERIGRYLFQFDPSTIRDVTPPRRDGS